MASNLKDSELKIVRPVICKNIQVGDTIEIHWVYSSCNIKPGESLGSCLSDSYTSSKLRVDLYLGKR